MRTVEITITSQNRNTVNSLVSMESHPNKKNLIDILFGYGNIFILAVDRMKEWLVDEAEFNVNQNIGFGININIHVSK